MAALQFVIKVIDGEKTERKDDRNSSMGSLEEFLEQFIEKSPNKK